MSKRLKQKLLKFPHKRLRAEVIYAHARKAKYEGIYVLSCGNASKWLRKVSKRLPVHEPKPDGWLAMEEIGMSTSNNEYFDGTSGHLPLWLMLRIARKFKAYFSKHGGLPNGTYYVPTGSGETIICLKLAYPKHNFVAVYNVSRGSKYEKGSPLNGVVTALFRTQDGYPKR